MIHALRKTWFSPDKIYIITGGLGGFGLELTEWIIEYGAQTIIICSNNGIRTGYHQKENNILASSFPSKHINIKIECRKLKTNVKN